MGVVTTVIYCDEKKGAQARRDYPGLLDLTDKEIEVTDTGKEPIRPGIYVPEPVQTRASLGESDSIWRIYRCKRKGDIPPQKSKIPSRADAMDGETRRSYPK